jgi:CRISPR/Cas system-associated exonuclease Cas4 (RecB family)
MKTRRYEYSEKAGWSFSRFDTFKTCKRQYFFDYYGKRYAPQELRERIEFLKSLQSPALLVGQIVHNAIAEIIKRVQSNGNEMPASDIKEKAKKTLAAALSGSQLIDSYYGSPISPARRFESEFQLESCLDVFLESRWYAAIRSASDEEKKLWIVEPEDFGEFRLDGLKAYARVDFAFPGGDGGLKIIDWKTGKRYADKHLVQMQGYILYAHDVHSFPLEKITAILEYLADDGDAVEYSMPRDDFEVFRRRIKKDLSDMHSYCLEPENNVPLPLESFALRANQRLCGWCRYRELCGR